VKFDHECAPGIGLAFNHSPSHTKHPLKKPIEIWLLSRRAAIQSSLNLALALGLGGGLLIVVQAGLLAWILNAVILRGLGLAAVWPALAILLPVFALRFVVVQAGERASCAAGVTIRTTLRQQLLSHIHALGPAWLEGQAGGDLANSVVAGIDALEGYYTRWLPNRALTACLPLVILVAVFPLDWVSGLVLLLTAPLIPVFMILIGQGAEDLNQRQWRQLARLSARFLDTLQGLTTLKLFNASRREAGVVAQLSDEYRQSTMKVLRVAFLSAVVLEFLATLGIAVVAVLIGFRLLYGHMHFQPGMFVLLLAPEFYLPLRTLGVHYHARMEAIGAAERILQIFDTPIPEVSAGTAPLTLASAYTVHFDNLTYAYAGQPAVLDALDLTFDSGTITALVGPSGAGKSTILKLLLGFVSAQSGRILINRQGLHEIDPASWLSQVSWVPQRAHIFAGSVLDNLLLARPDASSEAVHDAARQAGAHDFILTLPQGYDTVLGERGEGLSGGQIQRLGLARAFLKDAPVVLLDEPTANLDAHSQLLIHAAIRRLAQGRTVLLVAHRLSTAQLAQRIVVLERGRAVQSGTHAQLIAMEGLYARLAHAYREAA